MTLTAHAEQTKTKWKRYPAYRETGIEWVGRVPTHWQLSKVKYVADYINGAAFKPTDWEDEGLKIIRIQNLTDSEAEYNRFKGQLDPKYKIRRDDIMISWSASLGVHVWEDDEPAWLNQHIFKAMPNKQFVAKQYFLWLARWFIRELEKDAHGSTMQHLTKDKFGSFRLYLPPRQEQQAIAKFLDQETVRIDTLIAKKERLIELLQEKRTALISHAVTKGLDPNAPMKDSEIPGMGKVPRHWETVRNRFLFREVDNRSETGNEVLLSVHQKLGIVKRSDIAEYPATASTPVGYKICEVGDLVLNKLKAYLGVFFRSPLRGLVSPDYTVFRPSVELETEYYEHLFRHHAYIGEFNKRSKGVAIGLFRLYTDDFYDIPSLFPPVEEQRRILTYVHQEVSEIDALVSKLRASVERLREYRTALVSAAVTGKIDVRNADHPGGGDATNI